MRTTSVDVNKKILGLGYDAEMSMIGDIDQATKKQLSQQVFPIFVCFGIASKMIDPSFTRREGEGDV